MASLPLTDPSVQPGAAEADETALCWSVHLLRRLPRRLPKIGIAVAGALVLGLCFFHSLWLALLPVLALVLSLSEYLFPIRYTLTSQSARSQNGLTVLEIRWADVRRAYLTDEGVKLSPLRAKNSRFEALRGVYLRFDDGNREAVIAAIRQLLPREDAHG